MIVDTSAVLAVLFRESGFEILFDKLLATERKGIAAPSLLEATMILTARLGAGAPSMLDRFLQEFELVIISFGEAHWREAARAFSRYGKGQHPAGLNFGDCMSYAVARLADRPLLFVGQDFSQTDIRVA